MTQEIITYIIVLSASIYTLYNFITFIIPIKGKKRHTCSGGCAACTLSKNINTKIKIQSYKN